MAATATATADADAAPAGASSAPAPPAPPPVPDHCNYKNLLQEFAQQRYKKLPTYHHKYEGEQHQLQFECTVQVGSEQFSSAHSHRRLKEAEQDAAGVAYRILVNRKEGDVTDVLALIDQDMVLSKSILHEFSVKTKASQPSYSVSPKGLGLVNLFVASVLFAGDTYVGEAAINKKDAEQNAARVAIKSILARNDTCMSQIIRSKKNLITVITSLGHNKERGAVSQENTPTNNTLPFAAINFVPPVASAAYGTTNFVYPANVSSSTSMQSPCQVEVLNAAEPLQSGPSHTVPASQSISSAPIAVQRPNIIPAADPSFSSLAQAVPGSKKRKKNRFREQEAKEGRASSSISRIAK